MMMITYTMMMMMMMMMMTTIYFRGIESQKGVSYVYLTNDRCDEWFYFKEFIPCLLIILVLTIRF